MKQPNLVEKPIVSPLVIQNCPDLIPIPESKLEMNLGELVLKYVEVTSQYYRCQASALGAQIQEGKKEP